MSFYYDSRNLSNNKELQKIKLFEKSVNKLIKTIKHARPEEFSIFIIEQHRLAKFEDIKIYFKKIRNCYHIYIIR